jgi:hypothetical protein
MDTPEIIFGDRRLVGFDWDDGNRAKCQSHGVPIVAIEEVFSGAFFILDDPAHSAAERRFKAIRKDRTGRGIFVAFTLRERDERTFIRPISARYMHGKEMANYEKAAQEVAGSEDRRRG